MTLEFRVFKGDQVVDSYGSDTRFKVEPDGRLLLTTPDGTPLHDPYPRDTWSAAHLVEVEEAPPT